MSRQMISEPVQLTQDVMQPDRRDAVMTIYTDKLTFDLASGSFELHNPKLSTLPNLDTMMIVCSGQETTSDVYVFTKSRKVRRYCMEVLQLLGFEMLDCYRKQIPERNMGKRSHSLPAMPTILETE